MRSVVCQVKKKTWLGILENRVLEKVFGPKVEEVTGGWLQQIMRSFMCERARLRGRPAWHLPRVPTHKGH